MWLSREEWDRAEGIFQEILDEAPDSPYVPVALYGVGYAALRREDPERAIPLFQDLLKMGLLGDPAAYGVVALAVLAWALVFRVVLWVASGTLWRAPAVLPHEPDGGGQPST